MSVFQWIVNFILHMDQQLPLIIHSIGGWTYLVLFVVIFIETGLVYGFVALAAILGDTNNYWIGHYLGPKVFTGRYRWVKKEYLQRTEDFYKRHGRKTIFLARFVPIVRSFAPFVAGIGRMTYPHFISYNVFGGIIWTGLLIAVGYFFGNTPLIRSHFSLFVLAIIVVSTIPVFFEVFKGKRRSTASAGSPAAGKNVGQSD